MSYGFSITGDFGNILIDDTNPVFQVRERYPYPVDAGTGTQFKVKYPAQNRNDAVLVFLVPPASGVSGMQSRGGALTHYDRLAQEWKDILPSDYVPDSLMIGAPFTPHRFYPTTRTDAAGWELALTSAFLPPRPPTNYGMRVFDSHETCIYDSEFDIAYFRVPQAMWTFDGFFSSENSASSGGSHGVYARYSVPVDPSERIGFSFNYPSQPSVGVNVHQYFGFEGTDRSRFCMYVSWTKLASVSWSPPTSWSTAGLILASF